MPGLGLTVTVSESDVRPVALAVTDVVHGNVVVPPCASVCETNVCPAGMVMVAGTETQAVLTAESVTVRPGAGTMIALPALSNCTRMVPGNPGVIVTEVSRMLRFPVLVTSVAAVA